PSWYWNELEREISVEDYAQWVAAILDRRLSEQEVHELDSLLGDEKKNALIDELIEKLNGKKGEYFVRAVREFQRLHEQREAEEIIAFMQSAVAAKYGAARNEILAGRSDQVVKSLMAADKRVRTRHR